jgi:serine/threonine-protein kinase HipA
VTELERLRSIAAADVYADDRLAASLSRTPEGGTSFAYRADYLAADHARPIATTLPLSAEPVVTPNGALPAFFPGLLPEGHRLTVLRRAVKTSASDEFSLLLAVGSDTPGDVRVIPAGEAPTEASALIDPADPDRLDFRDLVDAVDTHGIPGVQDKASASTISAPVRGRDGRYILKLSPAEHPRLVENELLHLTAARGLRLPVAAARIIHDRTGTAGLLVQRFDRIRDDGRWRRLGLEDATQVLGLPPAAKYTVSAEEAVLGIASVCRAPAVAVRAAYLQFAFAWLTGNGDLHAKNVSVIRQTERAWSVAPMYDVLCTLVYGDDSMALPIAGRTRGLKARHWAEFADAIRLPLRAARSAEALALAAASRVDLGSIGFDGSPLHRVQRELRFRRAAFEHDAA